VALLSRLKKLTGSRAVETTPKVVLDKPGGKGRPTPKRREAVASRPVQPYTRTAVSTTKPGASKKDRRKAGKDQRRLDFQRQRTALKSGDTANLPLRDRGPERQLARDVVDRRLGGVLSYFPFVALVSLVGSFVSQPTVQVMVSSLLLAFIVAGAGDAFLLGRRTRAVVGQRFPDSHNPVRLYAVQRAVMPRRFRLPPPRVDKGAEI
jgi:hypothetical protein